MATKTDQILEFFKGDIKLIPRDLTFRLKFMFIVATILIVIVGNILLLMLPQTKGFLLNDLNSTSVMAFDEIYYELESGYKLDFDQGGFIVPIENNQNPLGIVIYASGEIQYDEKSFFTSESYIFLREDEYYEIMGNLLLYKSEEQFFIDNAYNSFSSILSQTPFLETPIGKKYYPLSENGGHIVANIDDDFINIANESESNLLTNPTFFLISLIHILFTIAILLIIIVLTDRKAMDEPNRSMDSNIVNSKPLWVSLLANVSWLILLYLGANMITVQIVLMVFMLYIFYLLHVNNKIRLYDLKLINHSKHSLIILPVTIAIITFLFFGNTSVTLQSINIQLTFVDIFFYLTSAFWISFISFSFIPMMHREFSKEKYELVSVILYNVIVYIGFCLIQFNNLNVFHYFNAAIFIPIFATLLNTFAKRTYNFISPVITIVLVRILINIIR